MAQTMIDKYGRVRVRRIVADFYNRVLTSRRLGPYFEDIDIQGLVSHQTAFLEAVMGGPPSHSPAEIARAHDGMGVSEGDFEEMVRLLTASLEKFAVEQDDIETISDRYRAFERAVVAGL